MHTYPYATCLPDLLELVYRQADEISAALNKVPAWRRGGGGGAND